MQQRAPLAPRPRRTRSLREPRRAVLLHVRLPANSGKPAGKSQRWSWSAENEDPEDSLEADLGDVLEANLEAVLEEDADQVQKVVASETKSKGKAMKAKGQPPPPNLTGTDDYFLQGGKPSEEGLASDLVKQVLARIPAEPSIKGGPC